MKLQMSFIALVVILLCCLFACSQPKLMPPDEKTFLPPSTDKAIAENLAVEKHIAKKSAEKSVSIKPSAGGSYTQPTLDPRDKLIKEQSALLKLYEARIKELEETISRGGR